MKRIITRRMKRRVARWRRSQAVIVLDGKITLVRVTKRGEMVWNGKVWPKLKRAKTYRLVGPRRADAPTFKGIEFEYVESLDSAALYSSDTSMMFDPTEPIDAALADTEKA